MQVGETPVAIDIRLCIATTKHWKRVLVAASVRIYITESMWSNCAYHRCANTRRHLPLAHQLLADIAVANGKPAFD
jgi:hypothetical protein